MQPRLPCCGSALPACSEVECPGDTFFTGAAPEALAAFRNLAISLLHRWQRPAITAARQDFANHPAALIRSLRGAPLRL
jgi:hypothetical protein